MWRGRFNIAPKCAPNPNPPLELELEVADELGELVRMRFAGDSFLGAWARRLRSFMNSVNKGRKTSVINTC